MVLDEAHNWMNARSWKEGGRERVVKFATQHRKIGWNMYVITQDAEMIDKQVRNLFEYHVHLKNLRRFKVLGIPIFPFNLFMAVTQWAHAQRAIVSRESYRLHRKVARLYDTMATSHGLDDDPALLIMLPVVPDGPPS
jgi:zona occludens toxin (predicted ATPase)